MGLGLGITLIVVGAILGFTDIVDNALDTNLDTIGWILLIAGILSIVVGLIMNGQRSRSQHTEVIERRGDVPPRDY
ncbi:MULTISPECIES: DUF6458 family protein [unclassified Janibacter]|uniref:DUF6458 family protein n=1 Tax=unclassified Janibacter TaxID=2649294 RepID=UPI003CFE8CF2